MRRITDAPFSVVEANAIRHRLALGEGMPECPRCASVMRWSEAASGGRGVAVKCQMIRCPRCRRMVTLDG